MPFAFPVEGWDELIPVKVERRTAKKNQSRRGKDHGEVLTGCMEEGSESC